MVTSALIATMSVDFLDFQLAGEGVEKTLNVIARGCREMTCVSGVPSGSELFGGDRVGFECHAVRLVCREVPCTSGAALHQCIRVLFVLLSSL